ncbi:methyltransferase domain-containing protein [Sphingobacterium sp. 2149]|uniref:methyltransferase domain-containing protein n=1 Tax=Sphingobacterium sp. 2149 TaxID=2817763 RepID=UPI002859E2F0|nr:methyltransferase domain-containing protein [Sphingobacterium sp. 2149]MDR6733331.1 2-polyprenyl-3-methyl-5-hydroxy-6-metoxy-1,4-benzoquinol methylase [Sphingobacterium sp. 2149]
MAIDLTQRTSENEIMDDFLLEGDELRGALDQISKINRFLGGNSITLDGVKKMLSNDNSNHPIRIVDIGCGNGDMLRMLSDYADNKGIQFELFGLDANRYTINHARSLSKNYTNITYVCADIFEEDFEDLSFHIVLCTLTIHHFNDENILNLIARLIKMSKLGIIINDLHRSKIAYRLFQTIAVVFRLNRMTREDGLISIRRGFKKDELVQFAKKLHLENYTVQWKWAFRYQWIISNI